MDCTVANTGFAIVDTDPKKQSLEVQTVKPIPVDFVRLYSVSRTTIKRLLVWIIYKLNLVIIHQSLDYCRQ